MTETEDGPAPWIQASALLVLFAVAVVDSLVAHRVGRADYAAMLAGVLVGAWRRVRAVGAK